MGEYGPKPIHEIGAYRRLGRNALVFVVAGGVMMAFQSGGGAVDLWSWLLALGLGGTGVGLGLWNARTIVARADEVYRPGTGVGLAPLVAVGLVVIVLGVLKTVAGDTPRMFFMGALAVGVGAYLTTMGSTVAVQLSAIRDREQP